MSSIVSMVRGMPSYISQGDDFFFCFVSLRLQMVSSRIMSFNKSTNQGGLLLSLLMKVFILKLLNSNFVIQNKIYHYAIFCFMLYFCVLDQKFFLWRTFLTSRHTGFTGQGNALSQFVYLTMQLNTSVWF